MNPNQSQCFLLQHSTFRLASVSFKFKLCASNTLLHNDCGNSDAQFSGFFSTLQSDSLLSRFHYAANFPQRFKEQSIRNGYDWKTKINYIIHVHSFFTNFQSQCSIPIWFHNIDIEWMHRFEHLIYSLLSWKCGACIKRNSHSLSVILSSAFSFCKIMCNRKETFLPTKE